jgi:putative membrane protein
MAESSTDRLAEHERHLAEERTRLARERTTLAHSRTGFASFLFGTALLGLFRHPLAVVTGAGFVLIGAGFLPTGWRSYASGGCGASWRRWMPHPGAIGGPAGPSLPPASDR